MLSSSAAKMTRGYPTILPHFFCGIGNSKVHYKRWKKDVVYLYQFKRSSSSPNISPFCFKIETWLRANELKYEDELKEVNVGAARAVDRMIECNTHYLLLYFIFVENLSKFLKISQPSLIKRWLVRGTMSSFHNKVHQMFTNIGISNCSRNDLIDMLLKDIGAIDVILGDKKFLFGVKPIAADFTVFGHLASSYYLPFRQPITDILDDKYPRVKRLIERMRQHYYPEWEFNT
uniref:Metaxin glutathione S-transferase domain-containing protein n=1 Tax=Setaria digitata TaxID=48799 RepID=A0A915Q5M5_9BILA